MTNVQYRAMHYLPRTVLSFCEQKKKRGIMGKRSRKRHTDQTKKIAIGESEEISISFF